MGLQDISKAVAAHLSTSDTNDLSIKQSQPDGKLTKFERWGLITLSTGILMLFLLLISFIVSMLAGRIFGTTIRIEAFFNAIGPWIGGIALPMLLGGSIAAAYPRIARELGRSRPSQPDALPQSEITKELSLANPPELVASVTEHTTRNLE
jgi:hypothetical protein